MSYKELNLENLILISRTIFEFDHFVFYGTLLGITRNNSLLDNDDDIDFLIDIKFKDEVLKKIKKENNFEINEKVCNQYFVQLIKIKKNIKTFIDLYFYINNEKDDYIIEKHNFLSSINIDEHAIHIPKQLVFPIRKKSFLQEVNLPNKCHELCEFLYGETWLKPLKKNSAYRMEIIKNKPKLIQRSFIGSLSREIKNFFSQKFKKK